MNKIIFFCNWGENCAELKKKYNNLTKFNNYKWKKLEIVDNIKNADWFIFMDIINIDISNLDKSKIIIVQREPYINADYKGIKNILNYNTYIHLFTCIYHIGINYQNIFKLNIDNQRNKLCSAVVSKFIQKKPFEAYKSYLKRISFIKTICKIDKFNIDVFGYNWKKDELGNKYKGVLGGFNIGTAEHIENLIPNTTKVDGLIDYKYSIAIENCKKNNYISEKFTDCILCGTMPIYYGADNVTDYFPKDCFYSIDIESPTCLVDLYNILKKPISEKNKNAIKQARDLILNKYNMLEKLNEIIKS
jgi:hypothetical protein